MPQSKAEFLWSRHVERLSAVVRGVADSAGGSDRRRRGEILNRVLPDRPEDIYLAAKMFDPPLSPTGSARPLLDRALALLTDRMEGLSGDESFLKGQIHEALGEDDAAIRAYKHALSFAGARAEWRYHLVKMLVAKARWKEAQGELGVLLRQMPDDQQVKDWADEVGREISLQ
jgi:tetratricopeptide (TPR) repeat protein